ncbi:MAG: hypothetical protein FJ315_08090 [SAR202 cluster bacterium]|nr:hypothetical protein [SAR202 cluster bacterium]
MTEPNERCSRWGDLPTRLEDAARRGDEPGLSHAVDELREKFERIYLGRAGPARREIAEDAAVEATVRVVRKIRSGKVCWPQVEGFLNTLAYGGGCGPTVFEELLRPEQKHVGNLSLDVSTSDESDRTLADTLADPEPGPEARGIAWAEADRQLQDAWVAVGTLKQGRIRDTLLVVLEWLQDELARNRRAGLGPEVPLLEYGNPERGGGAGDPEAGDRHGPRPRTAPELLDHIQRRLNVNRNHAWKLLERSFPRLTAWGLMPPLPHRPRQDAAAPTEETRA